MHARMHARMHTDTQMHAHTQRYTHKHMRTHMHAHAHMYTHTHTHACTHTHRQIQMHEHACMQAHRHMYTHTHTQSTRMHAHRRTHTLCLSVPCTLPPHPTTLPLPGWYEMLCWFIDGWHTVCICLSFAVMIDLIDGMIDDMVSWWTYCMCTSLSCAVDQSINALIWVDWLINIQVDHVLLIIWLMCWYELTD